MSTEHEGRMFGSQIQLEDDFQRYASRLDLYSLLANSTPHMRMTFTDGSKITWILIKSYEDFHKLGGYEFSQMMFDLSFPHDCLSMCLSRLRSASRRISD